MLTKLFVCAVLLIHSIECQQMVTLLRSASNQNSETSQPPSQQSSQSQQSSPKQSQPQLLSLEQQQQLLQQLAALTAAQQRQQQQPQQQFFQQPPQQQFFDPNQQFFGPPGPNGQGQGPPQGQHFFNPQQFLLQPQPQQQFNGQSQPPQQQPPQQQPPQQQPPQAQSQPQSQVQSQPQPAQAPNINWGKCPQLEPSDNEKTTKASVITKCLETTPLPPNITRETVELHREQIAACALQSEGWFTGGGGYDFGKAETEIKNKKLVNQIQEQVLGYHKQCKEEAEEKFPTTKNTVIAQIQLYQACMDYFISDVCGIEVNEPEAPQFTGSGF